AAVEAELLALPEGDGLGRERASFAIRSEQAALQRLDLADRLAEEHLVPARTLRDTALALHDHMASYVAGATRVVDRAGGRVAVVGLLADAPGVVADLHAS